MNQDRETLKNICAPIVVFTALALVLMSPIFYNAVPVKTITKYMQFPLWNPYYCGGNAMLAGPESTFLAPPFLFLLLFGELKSLIGSLFF